MTDTLPSIIVIRRRLPATLRAACIMLAAPVLGGCVANSSNPSVSITSATMQGNVATMDLDIQNPGGRHLELVSMEYELSHGEAALPVAAGTWKGSVDLKPGLRCTVPLTVTFDAEPMEPDSGALHLNGTLHLRDRTGFMGLKSMDLGATPFQASATARIGTASR
jgi:hypothetical protein